jgi:hypothetical protein
VSWAADSCSYRSCRSPPSGRPDLSIESIETSSFIGYHYPPITQISILSPPSRVYLFSIFETVFTIDGEVFTLNQRLISSIERASTPHRRGISEVTPRPEREEEDRQTRSTQKPNLAGGTGTQGADALAEAQAEAEARPTRRSQRQRKTLVIIIKYDYPVAHLLCAHDAELGNYHLPRLSS